MCWQCPNVIRALANWSLHRHRYSSTYPATPFQIIRIHQTLSLQTDWLGNCWIPSNPTSFLSLHKWYSCVDWTWCVMQAHCGGWFGVCRWNNHRQSSVAKTLKRSITHISNRSLNSNWRQPFSLAFSGRVPWKRNIYRECTIEDRVGECDDCALGWATGLWAWRFLLRMMQRIYNMPSR